MKTFAILTLAAASLAAAPALAQGSHTGTFETPRYEGERTVAWSDGTLTRETDVTRKSDGATASSDFVRQRTDTGVTRSRASSDFQDRASSTYYERNRTPHGWQASGEHAGRGGNVVGYEARGVKTPRGRVAGRRVTVNGEVVAARGVRVTHRPHGTTRRVVRRR